MYIYTHSNSHSCPIGQVYLADIPNGRQVENFEKKNLLVWLA